MQWVFKTSAMVAFPITTVLSIILSPLVYVAGSERSILDMWVAFYPLIIFFATFTATGLVLFLYWGRKGIGMMPKTDIEKLREDISSMEERINKRIDDKFDMLSKRLDSVEKKLRERVF